MQKRLPKTNKRKKKPSPVPETAGAIYARQTREDGLNVNQE